MKLDASLRIKKRYILIQGNKDDVEKAILDYIGILGWAKASPVFVKVNKNDLILAVDRKELNNVRAAFEICKSDIKIKKVSGTLKGLEK